MDNDVLLHYGVLGMKWGVRKDKIRERSSQNLRSALDASSHPRNDPNVTSAVTAARRDIKSAKQIMKETGKRAKQIHKDLQKKARSKEGIGLDSFNKENAEYLAFLLSNGVSARGLSYSFANVMKREAIQRAVDETLKKHGSKALDDVSYTMPEHLIPESVVNNLTKKG